MTQLLIKTIADFSTTLTSKTAIGATTATLTSGIDSDSIQLPTGVYGFTIDRNNTQKEHFTATLTGSSLTDIKTVTRGTGVGTSGFVRPHRKGAEIVITDHVAIKRMMNVLDGTTSFDSATPLGYDGAPTISTGNQFATKTYVDGVAIAGSPDATTATKGITKMSVAPVSASSPIAVGDNDGRVPTQSENDALIGNNVDVSVGTGNKYVTQTGLQHNAERYVLCTSASSTAYTGAYSPAPTSITDGMEFLLKIDVANTTTNPTFNPNGLGAKTIVKGNSSALLANDLAIGQVARFIYNGTNMVLQNPSVSIIASGTPSASINGTSINTTQNIDTSVTMSGTAKTIIVNFWLKGFSGAGNATYSTGTAYFDGATIRSYFSPLYNTTSTTISATTYTVGNVSPVAGGDASNGGWTMSIQSLTSTGFTFRLTYTQGSTFNGGDYKCTIIGIL